MATVYMQSGTGTGSGTLLDPYYFSERATAEAAAGEGGTIKLTDGTYTSFNGFLSSIDSIIVEALNFGKVFVSGITGSLATKDSTGDKNLTLRGLSISSSSFQNYSGADHYVSNVEDCIFTDAPTIRSSSGLSTFTRCSFGYGMFIAAGTSSVLNFVYCSIYQPTASRLNSNNQTFKCNNCIITCVSDYDQGGDLDWYATSGSSNNWFYNWDGYSTATSGVIGDTDPKFNDPTNGDLRLKPNSPCINFGT